MSKFQSSRLSKLGKQTLNNKTNFTLLQEINYEDSDDHGKGKILNHSTVFLDDNDNQLPSTNEYLPKTHVSPPKLDQQYEQRTENMYKLPGDKIGNIKQNKKTSSLSEMRRKRKQEKLERRNYEEAESWSDSKSTLKNNFKNKSKSPSHPHLDLIGQDLFEIEDIISDISKIVESENKYKIVEASQTSDQKVTKKSKTRKFNFNGFKSQNNSFNRLDEMLMNYSSFQKREGYKDVTQQPVQDSFYPQQSNQHQRNTPQFQRFDKMSFQNQLSSQKKISLMKKQPSQNKGAPNLSFAVIRMEQVPVIPAKWNRLFLKFQSYPQQQGYKKVLLKSLGLGLITYSIFIYEAVGVIKEKKQQAFQQKLMSEESFAKKWQEQFSKNSQQKCALVSEEQKQTLMQLDIQWYRTLIQFCYRIGLEDLLEKQYDIDVYLEILKEIKDLRLINIEATNHHEANEDNQYKQDFQDEEGRSQRGQKLREIRLVVLENQMKYIDQYFRDVYDFGTDETILGLIRVENSAQDCQEPSSEQANDKEQSNLDRVQIQMDGFFKKLYEDNPGTYLLNKLSCPNSSIATELIFIRILCGDPNNLEINEDQIYLKMKKNSNEIKISLNTVQKQNRMFPFDYEIKIRGQSTNSWQLNFSVDNDPEQGQKGMQISDKKIILSEQLLFGGLYRVPLTVE